MKINTENFKKTLNNSSIFVENRKDDVLSSSIIINIKEKLLKIEVYSLEGKTTSNSEIENKENIEMRFIIFDVKEFKTIIDSIKNKKFNIKYKENLLIILDGKRKFEIGIGEIEDREYKEYEAINELKDINYNELKDILIKLVDFTAKDELRPIMNGVNVNSEHFVATTSSILMTVKNSIIKVNEGDEFTISNKFINKLINLKLEGEVSIRVTKNTFTIKANNFETSARLIEGKYPNYRAVIPEFKQSIIIEKDQIIPAFKDSLIINKTIELTIKDKIINLLAINVDTKRTYENSIELSDKQGTDIRIGMNINNLSICMNAFDKNELIISYEDVAKPFVITTIEKGEDELALCMPVILQ